MNYKKIAVVILLSLVIFSTANAIYAEDKEYSIIDALIDLTIQEDGLLHVNESYTYSFEGTFNGVYRDIPLKDGESIDNLNVYIDGMLNGRGWTEAYREGRGQFMLSNKCELRFPLVPGVLGLDGFWDAI